jgi:hypothetical protein
LAEAQVYSERNPQLHSRGSSEGIEGDTTNQTSALPPDRTRQPSAVRWPVLPPAPPPTYRRVSRSQCGLLRLCYEQRWEDARRRVQSSTKHRDEARCRTQDTLRTALHLSTLPGTYCPPPILLAILEANPHAATVRDRPSATGGGSTPLHLLCGGRHKNDRQLIRHFVDAATSCSGCEDDGDDKRCDTTRVPKAPVHLYSPLFVVRTRACLCRGLLACRSVLRALTRRAGCLCLLACVVRQACRENARPETIQLLVEAASFGTGPSKAWIAPVTGAEPWNDPVAVARLFGGSGPDDGRLAMMKAPPPFVPLAELWRHVHHLLEALQDDPDRLERMRHITLQLLQDATAQTTDEGEESSKSTPIQLVAHAVDDRTRAWTSIVLLLRPYVASFETLLHAVVNIGLPSAVPIVRLYQIICRLFPDLLEKRDANEQQPLHAALQRPPELGRIATRVTASSSRQSLWTRDILPMLVRSSVESRPDCATAIDPRTRLFPALLAASTNAPVTVVYELLQASVPCLFRVE